MFHIKNNYYNYKGRENFEGLKAETKNSLGFFCCFFFVCLDMELPLSRRKRPLEMV